MAISVCKSPIYEQSSRVIFIKRKKVALEKYLRIPASSAIFIYISCFAAEIIYWYWKISFAGKIGQKIGQFLVYNFAKKMKIEISKKLAQGKRKIYDMVFKFW